MGTRGPVPTRSDQRRRTNTNSDGLTTVSGPTPVARVVQPAAESEWHPMARDWYNSLGESGQSRWYQPSDWQTARVWAELLSRQLEGGRVSAQLMAAWSAAATELLTTEGARRRVRIELEAPAADEDEAASDLALVTYLADING